MNIKLKIFILIILLVVLAVLVRKIQKKKIQWPITDCSSSDLYRHGSNSGGKRVL